jgi:hypothetical protein
LKDSIRLIAHEMMRSYSDVLGLTTN